jgi:hypothetical protein
VADAVGHHPSRTGTIALRAAVLLRTARHNSCIDPVSTEIGVRDMQTTYATTDVAPHNRRQFWQEVVSRTYFPLDLSFAGGNEFNGSLGAWSPGRSALFPYPALYPTDCSTNGTNAIR